MKIAKATLIVIMSVKSIFRNVDGKNGLFIRLKTTAKTIAKSMFEAGPERAIKAPSFFGFLKL